MEIIQDVFLLEASRFSHVYLIKGKENILIDTGLPGMANRILSEMKSLGAGPGSITKILLTHHDVDHTGNLYALQKATGAKVYVSEKDAPYVKGELKRPGIKHVFETVMMPKKAAEVRTFTDGARFGDVQPFSAPGHTPGHTIYKFGPAVFTGDLFRLKNGRLSPLSRRMNWDEDMLFESIRLLDAMDFVWLCPGHGRPIKDGKALLGALSRK